MLGPAEKALNIALALAVLGGYALLALRLLRGSRRKDEHDGRTRGASDSTSARAGVLGDDGRTRGASDPTSAGAGVLGDDGRTRGASDPTSAGAGVLGDDGRTRGASDPTSAAPVVLGDDGRTRGASDPTSAGAGVLGDDGRTRGASDPTSVAPVVLGDDGRTRGASDPTSAAPVVLGDDGRTRGGVTAGLRGLLARAEPAVWLDSARVIALLGWLPYVPDAGALAGAMAGPLAVPKGLFHFVEPASIPIALIHVAIHAYRIALVLAAFGVLVRASSLVAALANVFLWSVAFSFEHTAHWHAVPLILLALALSPVKSPTLLDYARALRERRPLATVGSYPAWVRWAVIFAIVTAYFQAGIEKLIRSGPLWLNGTTLAGHLLRVGTELGQELAAAPQVVLVLASFVALIWELAYGLVLFFPRLRWAGALTALGFHAFLYETMALGFRHLTFALVFLVPPYLIATRARDTAPPARVPGRARLAALALLLALQWVPSFVRGGVYPFLNYDMFNGYYRGDEVMVRRAHLFVSTGEGWRELDPARALSFSAAHFTEQVFYRYVSEHPRHARYAAERASWCRALLETARARVAPGARALRVEAETVRAGAPGEVDRAILATCEATTTD